MASTAPRLATPSAPAGPARSASPEERKIREVFEHHGRAIASPASARAFAEANPRLAAELGITVEELAARNTRSITLEEAVQHGLFEPIEDDPLARFRKT